MQPFDEPSLPKQTPAGLWKEHVVDPMKRMGFRLDDKFPLRRNNKEPYVRHGEVVYPPYENIVTEDATKYVVSREEFCFGYPIRKITPQTLLESCNDGTIDNSSHREQHLKYEYDGELRSGPRRAEFLRMKHIAGYCSVKLCHDKGVQAIPAGQYCRFRCASCLASAMNAAYAQDDLGTCALFFMPNIDEIEDYGTIYPNTTGVSVRFNDGMAHIGNTNLNGYFIQVPPRGHEHGNSLHWTLPWMLVITTPLIHTQGPKGSKPQSSIYLGMYRGHVKGRYVCRNIILGLECRYDSKARRYRRFCERVVPGYYPGWEEQGLHQEVPGSITLHSACWSCEPPAGRDATLEYMRTLHEELIATNETYRNGDQRVQRVMLLAAMSL